MKEQPKVPRLQVQAFLLAEHPALHAASECERDWIWLVGDLRGDENKETRESIKAFGFKFAANGHTLPSGRVSHWAHHCEKPIPFKRRRGAGQSQNQPSGDNTPFSSQELAEANALFA